jgi:hypothetical protein
VLAEMVGIEHIVGAFFAGLALNRLVPNEGPLMHRVEFFGSTVFIPVFLVSVGLIMDPQVMIEPETLALAGLFCLACLGGKAVAVAVAKPVLGFTWPQAGVMFVADVAPGCGDARRDDGRLRARPVRHAGRQRRPRRHPGQCGGGVDAGAEARRAGRSVEEVVPPGSHVMVVVDGDTPTAPLVRLAGRLAEPDGGRVSVS